MAFNRTVVHYFIYSINFTLSRLLHCQKKKGDSIFFLLLLLPYRIRKAKRNSNIAQRKILFTLLEGEHYRRSFRKRVKSFSIAQHPHPAPVSIYAKHHLSTISNKFKHYYLFLLSIHFFFV